MTKEELIKNLGTVARTGTSNFVEALASGADLNLIGQFGVGFYSNFLVADQIVVTSKSNHDDQHIWVSRASSYFNVFPDPRGNTLGRGTRITIKLKNDATNFLDEQALKKILKKYSEFVDYPMYLKVKKEVSREVPMTDDELEARAEGDDKTTKVIKESIWDWEYLNPNKPIWLRDEVKDEEYYSFYKALSKDTNDPLSYIHFTAEGEVEFKALLFIPSRSAYDVLSNHYNHKTGLKLYVRRVLISDEFEDLLPRYMNFVKGVVDSDDLPLNVARQDLQQKKILKLINKKLVRKILQELIDMANVEEDDEEEGEYVDTYKQFYEQFGKNIKLGIMEDTGNKSKLSRLLRFYSTHNSSDLTSLDDYIERMKDGQDDIYYIAGEDRKQLENSPLIQKLVRQGYEVLLLDDPIDEYCIDSLTEYEQHKLQNVARDDWKLPEDDELEKAKEKGLKKMYAILTDWLKGLLPGRVAKVELTRKLYEEPSIVTTNEQGYSANMERITKAQTLASSHKTKDHQNARKTWEINPAHPLIKKLDSYANHYPSDKEPRDIAMTMFDVALLQSGFVISKPVEFYNRAMNLILEDMGIKDPSAIEEPHVEVDFEGEDVERLDHDL